MWGLQGLQIYIAGYHYMKISKDVTFDEDVALKRSRKWQVEEVYEEEGEAPKVSESMIVDKLSPDDEIPEDRDMLEQQEPPRMTISHERKPAWVREIIQDVEKYGAP